MVMVKEKKPPPIYGERSRAMIEIQWWAELKAWEVVITQDELLTIKVVIDQKLMRDLLKAVEGRDE